MTAGERPPRSETARASGEPDGDPQPLQVVVYSENGRSVGLVVAKILDIAEEVLTTTSDLEDHGLLGSAVVQNKITEMLDVHQAILGAAPHFYDVRTPAAGELSTIGAGA